MDIGTYLDGRSLSYDESTGSFAVGGAPVSADQIRLYLKAGQISWNSFALETWFETSFPPSRGMAPIPVAPQVPKKNKGIIIATIVAALILALGGITAAVIALRAAEANNAGADAEAKASIPSLEFIDPSSLPQSANIAPGTVLDRGSYTVFMTGERIQTVQWVENANNSQGWDLHLKLDSEGAEQLAQLTSENVGKQMPLAIGGKVITAPVVQGPILGGNIVISGSSDLRTIVGPTIVPEP